MTTSDHSNEHKTLDAALESAFASGVAFGAGYPAVEAIPEGFSRKAYLRWRDRWTGLPHEGPTEPPRDAPKASVVRDLLLLVQDEYPRSDVYMQEVLTWDAATRRDVVEWASAVHLVASDNEGIVIPPMPGVLDG